MSELALDAEGISPPPKRRRRWLSGLAKFVTATLIAFLIAVAALLPSSTPRLATASSSTGSRR